MNSAQNKTKSCNMAQLRNAIDNYFNPRITKKILSKKIDINHMFPCDLSFNSSQSELKFCTALHLASTKKNVENFKILLNYGADMTIKDCDGMTCLHRIIKDRYSNSLDEPLTCSFISSVLSAHVKSSNSVNCCDNNGLSHFHVACMMNDDVAVEFFLNNGVSVNQAVNADSSLFPGFTPLHFAAKFVCLKTAELLLKYGANAEIKNARGMTPLHVLVERKITALKLIDKKKKLEEKEMVSAVLDRINDNEKIMQLLLDSDSADYNCADDLGFSKLHAICTLQKYSEIADLLEQIVDIDAHVNMDSTIWPGYTMLHFAAHCDVNLVKLLLERGANIESKDANGLTPFDICMKRYKVEDLHSIMCMVTLWKNATFSNGKIKLLDCIAALKSPDSFKEFIDKSVDDVNMCLPSDSPLWPGMTLLHLSVIFAEQSTILIRMCLDCGMLITHADVHYRTPLHLAFRLNKMEIVNLLLRFYRDKVNSRDEENLCHLHIACAVKNNWVVKDLLINEIENNVTYEGSTSLPNVEPGWTPLHVAVWNDDHIAVKLLLEHGEDVNRVDKNGFTPIHLLLVRPQINSIISKFLLSVTDMKESYVDNVSLTHLHVASFFNNVKAVNKLLELASNIDTPLSFSRFDNCTPLHIAMMNKSFEVINLLVHRNADILAKRLDGSTPLSNVLTSDKYSRSFKTFTEVLLINKTFRERVKTELGLTMLHVACRAGQVDLVRKLINEGADVNAKMHDDAPFWPGWTPLHVMVATGNDIVNRTQNDFEVMLKLFFDKGARLTLTNTNGDSVVHLTFKKYRSKIGYFLMNALLNYQKDFSSNPVNEDNATHFHAACLANNVEVARKFLENDGIDIDQPIDYFAEYYAGSTPLHLALNPDSKRYFGIEQQMQMIDLLLKYKPNIDAEDDHGYTPLHVAADCDPSCLNLLKKLIDNGADINAQTIDGKTAFEMVLWSKDVSVEDIQFFVEHPSIVNGCNLMTDRGYLSIILNEKNRNLRSAVLKVMMDAPDIARLNEIGRSAIHNIVATNDSVISENEYANLIDKLTKLGCDVNEQDKSGMTALHLALLFRNKEATEGLLISGADINIIDFRGKTAFSYAHDPCTCCLTQCTTSHEHLLEILVKHVHKLQIVGLYVSDLNEKLKNLALENRWIRYFGIDKLVNVKFVSENIQKAKDTKIGIRGLTLHDFLKELDVTNTYLTYTPLERTKINDFFDSIDYYRFQELRYMLKVQYRQAVKRGPLINAAMDAIRIVMGFPLPELCGEIIFWHLRNADLKHLIVAASGDEHTLI